MGEIPLILNDSKDSDAFKNHFSQTLDEMGTITDLVHFQCLV